MGQSAVTNDIQVFQSTGASPIANGGTYVVTLDTSIAPYTDTCIRLIAEVEITAASAAHLSVSCGLPLVEFVVENKNGTVTSVSAIATSSNPINSNTAGFANTSRAAVSESGTSTAVWTIVSNKATLTVTNNIGVTANVSVMLKIKYVGSV